MREWKRVVEPKSDILPHPADLGGPKADATTGDDSPLPIIHACIANNLFGMLTGVHNSKCYFCPSYLHHPLILNTTGIFNIKYYANIEYYSVLRTYAIHLR